MQYLETFPSVIYDDRPPSTLNFCSKTFCLPSASLPFIIQYLTSVPPSPHCSHSFALIAMALAFALTFAFAEFINLGLCNLCCPRTFYTHPAFISRVQLYIILTAGLGLGLILGIMFGSMDVEDDWSASHSRLVKMLLYGLIPGVLLGLGVGVGSELLRDKLPANAYEPLPIELAPEVRGMPSGYDDI